MNPAKMCSFLHTHTYDLMKGTNVTRPSALENRCKLYPPERKFTKANQASLNLEGGHQGEI